LRKKGYAPGTMAWLYLVLAGLSRFTVEFWRINPSLALGLSEAQWFSLALAVVGFWLLIGSKSKISPS
jgi:prolipoprotein diacylglyceryltransferase